MSIRSTAARVGLSALLLAGALHAQAYIEQEQSTGVHNDAPSTAEAVGTLTPGSFVFISGSRQIGNGGSSADFFRFDVDVPQLATLSIETPNARARPVLGLFDDTSPNNLLLASAFDDNSTPSTTLSFAYQLTPGTYYAAVSGFRRHWIDFDGGGSSGWTYNLMLSGVPMLPAVPEPESMAMLLAGLGLLGLISRRR
jgi:hypothetical protein